MTVLTEELAEHIAQAIAAEGGWLGFDRFMALALYTPGLGYYANDSTKFGAMPESGSDFVTAPELTPLFGQTLAVQVGEALERTSTDEVWEFGARPGAAGDRTLWLAGRGGQQRIAFRARRRADLRLCRAGKAPAQQHGHARAAGPGAAPACG